MNNSAKQSSKDRIVKLATTAILVAMATVLSIIPLGIKMPLGGSLTPLSMLPICLISVMFGLKWGFAGSLVYALIQFLLDLSSAMGWGMNAVQWTGMIVFDYFIAFTILGIAGLFRNKGRVGALLGGVLALFLRFVSHVISGVFFFSVWMPEGWSSPLFYSVCYNGAFMLPEIVLTGIALFFIVKIPVVSKYLPAQKTKNA